MERKQIKGVFQVGDRTVTVIAMEQVGPEDAFEILAKAVMHRYLTNEDVVPATPREVKDHMIKQNLVV